MTEVKWFARIEEQQQQTEAAAGLGPPGPLPGPRKPGRELRQRADHRVGTDGQRLSFPGSAGFGQ